MGVTPLTPTQLWTNHRIEVEIPIVGNVVKVLKEYDVENQSLKDLFADPEWRGEAPLWFYILKEAEIVGQGPHAGPCRRADRGRGPRRPVAEGPQLVSVPEFGLEAGAARRAGSRASSPWPICSSTRGSGPNNEELDACERARCSTCKSRS